MKGKKEKTKNNIHILSLEYSTMPRICYVTGAGTKAGNTRSHSMTARKRTFKPNLITKKIKLDDGSTVKIKLSAKIYKRSRGFIA